MKSLEYRHIRTKKDLVSLYLEQYSEKKKRKYINDIIIEYRPQEKMCWNISLREALTFIELYGLPKGYELSETLKTELEKQNLKV